MSEESCTPQENDAVREDIVDEMKRKLKEQEESEDLADKFHDCSLDDEEEAKFTPLLPEEKLLRLQSKWTLEEITDNFATAKTHKVKANDLFKIGEYKEAMSEYLKGLELCPQCESEFRSIVLANIAAVLVQEEQQKEALPYLNKAIELNPSYLRAYLRRAKVHESLDNLDESLKDYQKVLEIDPSVKEALAANVRLPPLIAEKTEKMKTEMMGKLKDLGNLFLKPFGLSTENFQTVQDPVTGGYSISMKNN